MIIKFKKNTFEYAKQLLIIIKLKAFGLYVVFFGISKCFSQFMKYKTTYISIILASIIILLYSCYTTATSTIVGGQYEAKTNTTDYFVLPFGSVSLPGKWNKTSYNSSSRQQWFKSPDSISVAIAFTQCNQYEFYKSELKDFSFVKAYYEWDSKYLTTQLNMNDTILQADSLNNYIVWRLWGKNKELEMDCYFLFGYRNCSVHNFYVSTDKWTEEKKVKFLQDLYLRK